MRFFEHHIRMFLEQFCDVIRVILSYQRKQDTLTLECHEFMLHPPKNITWVVMRTKLYSVNQILADYTSPKSIVTIKR